MTIVHKMGWGVIIEDGPLSSIELTNEDAIKLRDELLKLYPLEPVKPEVRFAAQYNGHTGMTEVYRCTLVNKEDRKLVAYAASQADADIILAAYRSRN